MLAFWWWSEFSVMIWWTVNQPLEFPGPGAVEREPKPQIAPDATSLLLERSLLPHVKLVWYCTCMKTICKQLSFLPCRKNHVPRGNQQKVLHEICKALNFIYPLKILVMCSHQLSLCEILPAAPRLPTERGTLRLLW